MVEVRRSSRVANLPAPVYKEITLYERIESPSKRKYSYSRRDLANRVYASDEAREYAITKAEELEANLEGGHPSFVKPMLQSHVTGGFWLVHWHGVNIMSEVRLQSGLARFYKMEEQTNCIENFIQYFAFGSATKYYQVIRSSKKPESTLLMRKETIISLTLTSEVESSSQAF